MSAAVSRGSRWWEFVTLPARNDLARRWSVTVVGGTGQIRCRRRPRRAGDRRCPSDADHLAIEFRPACDAAVAGIIDCGCWSLDGVEDGLPPLGTCGYRAHLCPLAYTVSGDQRVSDGHHDVALPSLLESAKEAAFSGALAAQHWSGRRRKGLRCRPDWSNTTPDNRGRRLSDEHYTWVARVRDADECCLQGFGRGSGAAPVPCRGSQPGPRDFLADVHSAGQAPGTGGPCTIAMERRALHCLTYPCRDARPHPVAA